MMMSKPKNSNLGFIFGVLFACHWCWTPAYSRLISVQCKLNRYWMINDQDGFFVPKSDSQQIGFINISTTLDVKIPLCRDILLGGYINSYPDENIYMYTLFKEERSGFDCNVDPTDVIRNCTAVYTIKTSSSTLKCKRSKNPLIKLKFDLRTVTEIPYLETLSIPSLIISWMAGTHMLKINCIIDQISENKRQEHFVFQPFILVSKVGNSPFNKTCKDFISSGIVHFHAHDIVEYDMFRYIDGYDCKVNDEEIVKNTTEILKINSSTPHLMCKEKDVGGRPGPALDDFIKCRFSEILKTSNFGFAVFHHTEDYFIFVNSAEDTSCSKIIPSDIKNYDNTFFRFYVYKKEISGFECDVNDADLVKEHIDSYEYLTKPKGLVCRRWNSNRKSIPTLGAYENKTIQCKLNIEKHDDDCLKQTIETQDFITVETNENLPCHSFIWKGEVESKQNVFYESAQSFEFYVYKKEFSGYECDVQANEIWGETDTMYHVKKKESGLHCTKFKQTYLLDCYYQDAVLINGIPSASSFLYLAPAINVTSATKENCGKIISGIIVNNKGNGSVNLFLYKEEISGYKCFLEDSFIKNEKKDVYYIVRSNKTPLRCKKIEYGKDAETLFTLETQEEETVKENGNLMQIEQGKSGVVASDVPAKSEKKIDQQQITPTSLASSNQDDPNFNKTSVNYDQFNSTLVSSTQKKMTEVNASFPTSSQNPEGEQKVV